MNVCVFDMKSIPVYGPMKDVKVLLATNKDISVLIVIDVSND